jgi:hypothetical protein
MSKVLVVHYNAQELYHLPDWLDLEDTTKVKTYYVKWSILHVFLTDGRHITIKPTGDLDFDTKHGDCCDIDDADEHELELGEPEWEEVVEKKKEVDVADTKVIAEIIVGHMFYKHKS